MHQDECIPAVRDSDGIDGVPGGDEIYAYLVRRTTTTDITPAEIHELGLREVERIQGEMRSVMNEVGFAGDPDAWN